MTTPDLRAAIDEVLDALGTFQLADANERTEARRLSAKLTAAIASEVAEPTPSQDGMPPLPEPPVGFNEAHAAQIRTYGQQCADHGRSVERALWEPVKLELENLKAEVALWELAQSTREIEAMPDGRAIVREALDEALSACRSVATGPKRRVVIANCPGFWQAEEWCRWLESEVEPKVVKAIELLSARPVAPSAVAAEPAAPHPAPAVAEPLQQRVQPWLLACFGAEIAGDKIERNHRFLEEALELVQACGCTQSEAHQLVDYTFGRPVGDPHQEAGGVMITLAALCLANGLDMHAAAETELARIWTKVDQIRAKQAAKPKHSPLPEAPAASAEAGQELFPFRAANRVLKRPGHAQALLRDLAKNMRAGQFGDHEAMELAAAYLDALEARAALATAQPAAQEWQPIVTAPKTVSTLLLGYFNRAGKWRTVRGQWMSDDYIAEYWEDPDMGEAGWFETCEEADETPNCWPIDPSHWQPLPAAPQSPDTKGGV